MRDEETKRTENGVPIIDSGLPNRRKILRESYFRIDNMDEERKKELLDNGAEIINLGEHECVAYAKYY